MANSEMQYHAMGEVSSPRNYQDFSPPADTGPLGRKRTYSVLEGFPSSFTQPPFASRGPQSAFDAPGTSTDTHNATAMQSGAIAGNLFWHTPDEHGLPSGIEVDELKQTMEEDMTPLDVDDAAFNAYVDKIHPFVPILPQSKDRLLEQLHQCSREAQEVFLYALYTVTHTKMDRVANTFEKVQSFGSAQDHLLFYSRNLPLGPSATAQIVLFQTMLLMILDADTRGPDNLTNKDGIPKGTLLQIASTLGYDLARTYGQAHSSQRVTVADPDADSNVVRRCWVSFIILSRWYALSVSDPTFMRYDEVGTFEDKKIHDRGVLAISTFSSFIIDLITIVTEQPNICQSNIGMGRVIGNTLVGAIDRMNTNYSDLLSNISEEEKAKHPYLESLTSQLFWTMRLLIKRHLFVFSPYEVIYNAEKLLDEIYKATIQNRASTPFDYHSLALASMTLLEASVIPEHSEECWEHLKKLDEILDHRSARSSASANGSSEFEDILGTPGWDAKFKLYLEWRRAKAEESQIQELHNRRNSTAAPLMGPNEQRSLQHLADLAVGAEGSVTGNASPPPENQGNATSPRLATAASQPQGRVFVDFTMLTHKGYLNVFSGVAFKRAR
ncbi:hypothetical protein PHISCL_02415 [Aspergillus sclerotialis]|uniref:Transcription factor domain-containing protein n=1 Tax=Aspergillus sclerotialis TaxID=2070753 RepID=A0A3A3A5L3_9EURO|nr:hypothetical protein PHISCL_02415 [Aspergillus sclerotialis]